MGISNPDPIWGNEPFFLNVETLNDNAFNLGLNAYRCTYGDTLFLTLTPNFQKNNQLQTGTLSDFHVNSELVAQLFLRLQMSESRLNNYVDNFPGFFFCQRPDLSFTHIADNFSDLINHSTDTWFRQGGTFLEAIDANDRNFFINELDKNARRAKTFSLSYRNSQR